MSARVKRAELALLLCRVPTALGSELLFNDSNKTKLILQSKVSAKLLYYVICIRISSKCISNRPRTTNNYI